MGRDFVFKAVLVGNARVGKTSFLRRMVDDEYERDMEPVPTGAKHEVGCNDVYTPSSSAVCCVACSAVLRGVACLRMCCGTASLGLRFWPRFLGLLSRLARPQEYIMIRVREPYADEDMLCKLWIVRAFCARALAAFGKTVHGVDCVSQYDTASPVELEDVLRVDKKQTHTGLLLSYVGACLPASCRTPLPNTPPLTVDARHRTSPTPGRSETWTAG